jgi:hypothetical protein
MTKNLKILTARIFYLFFSSKFAIYLSLRLQKATGEAFSPQKRKSITSKHEFFLLLWVIFALLDPDYE